MHSAVARFVQLLSTIGFRGTMLPFLAQSEPAPLTIALVVMRLIGVAEALALAAATLTLTLSSKMGAA